MKTLVLGIGNPILTDDGVGPRVARLLKEWLDSQQATVMEVSFSGLELLDLMVGYGRVIIIDAVQTEGGRVGQVRRLEPKALGGVYYAAPVHGVNLATAIALGQRLGLALPRQMVIFAVEVTDVATFGEECTPAVRQAIPHVAELVLREIKGVWQMDPQSTRAWGSGEEGITGRSGPTTQ